MWILTLARLYHFTIYVTLAQSIYDVPGLSSLNLRCLLMTILPLFTRVNNHQLLTLVCYPLIEWILIKVRGMGIKYLLSCAWDDV